MHTDPHAALPASRQAKARAAELIDAGQRETAVTLLRDVLRQTPKDSQALHLLAVALMGNSAMAGQGKEPESLRHIRFASQLDPRNPEILTDYALICRSLGLLRQAHTNADAAIAADPNNARAIVTKARLLQSGNRVEEALELIQAGIARSDDPILRVIHADLCLHLRRCAEGIDTARPVFEDVSVPPNRRVEAAFILGHLHDALGEYDTAFPYFQTANTMLGPEPASNFTPHIERWTRQAVESIPTAAVDTSAAVLVIGMPRSGTTLTEMILAAHPAIAGVGESTLLARLATRHTPDQFADQGVVDAAATEYVAMLRQGADNPKAARVIDKMPENFIQLGLATRILPQASIIHCCRDARDTCLSIYFQHFGPQIKYAKSLESVADQYRGYLTLMDHWRQTLDTEILDTDYERLTGEPEPSVRRLLDHIGMPFHPDCLEHHKSKKSVSTASIAQVRRPIYKTSRQRWKNYEKHIGPLLERLEGL